MEQENLHIVEISNLPKPLDFANIVLIFDIQEFLW